MRYQAIRTLKETLLCLLDQHHDADTCCIIIQKLPMIMYQESIAREEMLLTFNLLIYKY